MIKIAFGLLLTGMMSPLLAQFVLPPITAEATDMARIKAAYNQAGAVSCKMTYLLFAASATQPTDSMTGVLTLLGANYHFKIAHFEYVQQGDRLLYVDHDAREMSVFTAVKSNTDPTNAGQLATLLDRGGTATALQNLGGNHRKITLNAPQAGTSNNVEIWYDTDTYFIKRTRTSLPQNNAVLDIKYGAFSREKGGMTTSIAAYAVLRNKKYTPTDKFRSYKIKVMG